MTRTAGPTVTAMLRLGTRRVGLDLRSGGTLPDGRCVTDNHVCVTATSPHEHTCSTMKFYAPYANLHSLETVQMPSIAAQHVGKKLTERGS